MVKGRKEGLCTEYATYSKVYLKIVLLCEAFHIIPTYFIPFIFIVSYYIIQLTL